MANKDDVLKRSIEIWRNAPKTDCYDGHLLCAYKDGFDDGWNARKPIDLQPVIDWLENGCNPLNAAKELRIYQKLQNNS